MEFVQEGITTLHDLTDPTPSVSLEDVGVVIPVMGRDVRRNSLWNALACLERVQPERVILSARGSREDVDALRRRSTNLDLRIHVLWCNAPPIQRGLQAAGIDGPGGKGRDVWLAMVVAAADSEIVVVHDADARSYTTDHVPRLAWPVANGFQFAKSYYARIEDQRLYGRLVRLLWMPLLAVIRQSHPEPFVGYLDAFRYPLSGEFAIAGPRVRELRLHPGWGLETGMLGEVYDHIGIDGCAQVDLGVHRHEHRPVLGDTGLASMSREIVGALQRDLEHHGIPIDITELAAAYARSGREFVERYAADATFNGLSYDEAGELAQISSYRDAIEDPITRSRLPAFEAVSLDVSDVIEMGRVPTKAPPRSRRLP